MAVRLFHFSQFDSIEYFEPRPVEVPSARPNGLDWLNGPLVWAIDEWHQPMYLFPRDCPRILLWRTPDTTEADTRVHFGDSSARIIAYVETGWLPTIETTRLWRYELPVASFESLEDAGMWVSRSGVPAIGKTEITEIPRKLEGSGVELRAIENLTPLRDLWRSTLHVSGIRLRNARGWR